MPLTGTWPDGLVSRLYTVAVQIWTVIAELIDN